MDWESTENNPNFTFNDGEAPNVFDLLKGCRPTIHTLFAGFVTSEMVRLGLTNYLELLEDNLLFVEEYDIWTAHRFVDAEHLKIYKDIVNFNNLSILPSIQDAEPFNCLICCEEDLLEQQMQECPEGHQICTNCIRR